MPDDSLTNAYRAARYQVEVTGGCLELKVDAPCEPLRLWLAARRHSCAALLTAHNPGSEQRAAWLNDEAQRRLHATLRARGLHYLTGRNLDPRGQWPVEDSVLVPDLSLHDAYALALQFGQRAFLWCDASATPRLHETQRA